MASTDVPIPQIGLASIGNGGYSENGNGFNFQEHTVPSHIWLDVDVGIDDAQGVMLGLTTPGVTVVGISCVAGNVGVDAVARNVARLLHACERPDVPFYVGASKNILGHNLDAAYFHGMDGLGDSSEFPHCPKCPSPVPGSAVMHLIDAVNTHPQKLTVVALGPLTNLALACRIDPQFASKVRRLVVMGGSSKAEGNTSATAEFNFLADPEAAYMTLQSFSRITLLPWELMVSHAIDWEHVTKWTSKPSPSSRFFKSIVENIMLSEKEKGYDFIACDPMAVAAAVDPTFITQSRLVHVTVELQGQVTRGQSVVDWNSHLKGPKNVTLVEKVDMARFHEMMDRATA